VLMALTFEVHEGEEGKFYWRLKDATEQTLASGGPYPTKSAAEKVVESIKTGAPDASVVYLEKPPKPLTKAEIAHLVAVERQAELKKIAQRRKAVIEY
jgi:uncharacterized protein YegP (UPF0339 family)